jgi:hypothetical protein
MARFSSGLVATGAGSSTLPIGSLYGGSTGGGRVREVGIFNTTVTALGVRLVRLTNTGTQGTGLVEAKHDLGSGPALCTAFDTHTADPTTGLIDLGYRARIGAAIGAGIVWTFGESGLVIPADTTEGVAIMPVGTGQILDWYIVWDE